jgi:hypothetical protein
MTEEILFEIVTGKVRGLTLTVYFCLRMMITYWQEIIALGIVAVAVWTLLRRYLFKSKPVKGAGAEACAPCSTGSCDGCAVMEEHTRAGEESPVQEDHGSPEKLDGAAAREEEQMRKEIRDKRSQWEKRLAHEISLREKGLK